MPYRQCMACPSPAVAGRSKCATHGPTSPRGPSPYGAQHQRYAREAIRAASVCAICGLPPTSDNPLQGDHIVPLSLGGRTERTNYQAAHRTCNISKGGANRFSP